MKLRKTAIVSATLLISCGLLSACNQSKSSPKQHYNRTEKVASATSAQSNNRPKKPNFVNMYRPSENKPYPKNLNAKKDQFIVSIPKQRVYIQHNNKTIYTMFASTGSHNRTPHGTFHVQKERGNYFYSNAEHEGARYYTSWKGHGVYLFHATPNNRKLKITNKVAKQLGKRPTSHGCIHLTLPDARYIETHAPVGMKVIIK